MSDKEMKEMYLKIKQLMEKQLELLSHKSQEVNSLMELVEISNQMVNISDFLINNY